MIILSAPTHDILQARALMLRINLLESAFRSCTKTDEMGTYLLQLELSHAYNQLMTSQQTTKSLILLSKVS